MRRSGLFAAILPLLLLGGCAEKGPEQITGNVVKTWINTWLNPPARQSATRTPPPLMYVNVDELARRHPAWQLASALEQPLTPLPPELRPLFNPVAPSTVQTSIDPAPPEPPIEVQAQVVRSGTDEKSRRDQQAAAGDQFLAATSRRQTRQARDEETLARQSLDERVDAARRAMLTELDPALLPQDVQLQLINLRLQLVIVTARIREERKRLDARGVTSESPERVTAEARWRRELEATITPLEEIEERWGLRLRAQEQAQAAKIRESYTEVPARIRREGEAMIAREAAERKQLRETERAGVRQTREELLDRDFAPGSLDLALRLPAADVVPLPPTVPGQPTAKKSQTLPEQTASNPSRFQILDAALARPGQALAQRPAQLRQLARKEATHWARLVVINLGGRLTSNPGAQNRTREAEQALFGPAGRAPVQVSAQRTPGTPPA